VTRLTDLPLVFKALIILLSLVLIVGVYIIYPYLVHNRYQDSNAFDEVMLSKPSNIQVPKNIKLGFGQAIDTSLTSYRIYAGEYLGKYFKWIFPLFLISFGLYLYTLSVEGIDLTEQIFLFHVENVGIPLFGLYLFSISVMILFCVMMYIESQFTINTFLIYMRKHFIKTVLAVIIPLGILYFLEPWMFLVLCIVFPPHFIPIYIYSQEKEDINLSYTGLFKIWPSMLIYYLIIFLLGILLIAGVFSSTGNYLQGFLMWHELFSVANASFVYFISMICLTIIFLLLPFLIYSSLITFSSYNAKLLATDLHNRFTEFGSTSKIFERT